MDLCVGYFRGFPARLDLLDLCQVYQPGYSLFRSAGEPEASQGDPERAPLLPEPREPAATS